MNTNTTKNQDVSPNDLEMTPLVTPQVVEIQHAAGACDGNDALSLNRFEPSPSAAAAGGESNNSEKRHSRHSGSHNIAVEWVECDAESATSRSPHQLLTLDFETYFDRDYSLKKLDYVSYISDRRFKVHCLAIRHPSGVTEVRFDVSTALNELRGKYGARLEKVGVVMHNAAFDAAILAWHYDLVPDNVIDTLHLARYLHSPDEPAGLKELAEQYELPRKGELDFMKGVREPSERQRGALANYAKRDVEITAELARLMIAQGIPEMESWASEHALRCWLERPFALNSDILSDALLGLEKRLEDEMHEAGVTVSEISGDKAFRTRLSLALSRSGRSIPMKMGKRGMIPALSSDDEAFNALLVDEDIRVRRLAGLRKLVKSVPQLRSKLEFLLRVASLAGGVYHPLLEYHKAGTGRYAGGGGFNVQNVPDPSKNDGVTAMVGKALRRSLRAHEGHVLVAVDACQIEARVLAWAAGQDDLHQAFADGKDVYSEFASEIFGAEVRKGRDDSPEEIRLTSMRNVGKTAVLGFGYGLGKKTAIANMRADSGCAALFAAGFLTDGKVSQIVGAYRGKYSKITEFWDACQNAFVNASLGYVTEVGQINFVRHADGVRIALPSGRAIAYPRVQVRCGVWKSVTTLDEDGYERDFEIQSDDISYGNGRHLYGGKIVENIVQALARDILVHVMQRLEAHGSPVVLHIHDEVICTVPEEQAEDCLATMIEAWRTVPDWAKGLILDAEGKSGRNLHDISK